jgi:hypothetical protein
VDRFISGLKDTIKHHVHYQKPDSLLSAYWYARQYEKAYLFATRKPIVPLVQRQGPLAPMRAQPARENRFRPPRKCWYCPKKLGSGTQMSTPATSSSCNGNART